MRNNPLEQTPSSIQEFLVYKADHSLKERRESDKTVNRSFTCKEILNKKFSHVLFGSEFFDYAAQWLKPYDRFCVIAIQVDNFETDPGISHYCLFEREWLRHKGQADKMVLMDIFGNSMEPELKNGDTVLIDGSQKDILAGLLYAVGIDDTIMVKRVEKYPGKLMLRSDNKEYAPIMIDGKDMKGVRIIGKVVWVCRNLT